MAGKYRGWNSVYLMYGNEQVIEKPSVVSIYREGYSPVKHMTICFGKWQQLPLD
jgi:hypothetical protein